MRTGIGFSRPARPAAALLAAGLLAWSFSGAAGAAPRGTSKASVSVFARGFNNPRGLRFGPDGRLYVAEGGLGGQRSTVGRCRQVPAPAGPYTGGFTGRISVVSRSGVRRTLVRHLPSSETSPQIGRLVSGVADVAFIGSKMYALLAGAGCSHGLINTKNRVLRVFRDGRVRGVANLSYFLKTHPVAHPNPPDFEPDGTWYSMTSVRGALYAVEPNHGEVDVVNPGVSVSRLIDISAYRGHIVPTAIAYHNGNFYLGNLSTFPLRPGASKIFRITSAGTLSVVAGGLVAVVGVAFDRHGRLYALENTTGNAFPTPNTGKIVRWDGSRWHTVASHLNLPTAMTFGPHGDLYVSVCGFGCPRGAGEVVRVSLG